MVLLLIYICYNISCGGYDLFCYKNLMLLLKKKYSLSRLCPLTAVNTQLNVVLKPFSLLYEYYNWMPQSDKESESRTIAQF